MLSRDKIAEAIISERGNFLGDDWIEVKIHSESRSVNIPYSPVEVTYKLDINTSMVINHGDGNREVNEKKLIAADCMFHYIYGDVLNKLNYLGHSIRHRTRRESEQFLDDLISEMKGK